MFTFQEAVLYIFGNWTRSHLWPNGARPSVHKMPTNTKYYCFLQNIIAYFCLKKLYKIRNASQHSTLSAPQVQMSCAARDNLFQGFFHNNLPASISRIFTGRVDVKTSHWGMPMEPGTQWQLHWLLFFKNGPFSPWLHCKRELFNRTATINLYMLNLF